MDSESTTYTLLNVLLLESLFKRNWVLSLEDKEFKNVVDIDIQHNANNKSLSVIVDLKFRGGIKEDNPEISADIKMVGTFKVPEKPDIAVENFISVNAPAIIFPFIREHIATLSMKAGINPIMLQPVNFLKRSQVDLDFNSENQTESPSL